MDRISTRCDVLDHHLNGGLPSGAITSLVSSPASQCSPLFHGFLQEHSWLYLTTYRSETAVRDELDDLLWEDVQVEHVGVERPVKRMHRVLESVDDERNVLVDTMNPLEATERRTAYVHLLNGLKDRLLETDSVALLHCTELETPPPLRETTLTVSDVVWELEQVVEGTQVENHLTIPKFRSMQTVGDVIKLELGEDVAVDTSKNIA